jgi:drug/metabolite transporter (DMT)-like permease
VLVTLADSSNTQQDHSVLGDGLAIGAAALYALYTILMRRSLAEDDGVAVARFFGYIGAGTALGVAPVLVVLQWWGALDVWDVTPLALALAVVNGEGVCEDEPWGGGEAGSRGRGEGGSRWRAVSTAST